MAREMMKIFGMMIALVISTGAGISAEETTKESLSPYFFVESNSESGPDSFPLKQTDTTVRINGVIADVMIRQTYANAGNETIHAKYIFPASTRAAVQGMTMTIGDRIIRAKIKEKETAKKEYAEAKKAGKSASLLSQKRPNLFSMKVANILPGDTVDIELHYTELLVPDDGVYEFVYPAVVGPRYSGKPDKGGSGGDAWVENPYLKKKTLDPAGFTITTDLYTGMPLYDVACSTHLTDVRFDDPAHAQVTLKEDEINPGNRDYILRYRLADKKIASGLMLYEGEDENFFLLTIQPPKAVTERDIPPREYIFVVDVSGSMNGFPLDVSKEVLKKLISSLRPDDLFNVVLFAGGSRQMAPTSVPATRANLDLALRVISKQTGGGGTELLSAMDRALKIPRNEAYSRSLVVVTDGYISGEREVFELIHENLAKTNVFAFGIGSSVNRYLIEGIAKAGMGEPFVVTRPDEAKRVTDRFCDYIKTPLLKDIQIDVDGFDLYDIEPSVIPDMFGERPILMVGKWRGPARGFIGVSGSGAAGPYREKFRVAADMPTAENEPLKYLWARTKIARLSDFSFGRNRDENREEITSLGLTYNLLTKYTSFIAVSEVVRNPGGEGTDVKQPLPLPKGVSELAVGSSVTSVPEPELLLLIPIMGMIWLVAVFRRKRSREGAGLS